jgi:hypothetical protein
LLAALSKTFDETALSMHTFQHDGVVASKARHVQRDAARSARRLQTGIVDTVVAHEGRDDIIEVIVKGDKDAGEFSEDIDMIEVVASSTTP